MTSIEIEKLPVDIADTIRNSVTGYVLTITENEKPIGSLTYKVTTPNQLKRGMLKGAIKYIAPDFDATPEGFEEYMP